MGAPAAASLRQALARAMMLATGGALTIAMLAMLVLELRLTVRDEERLLANVGHVIATYSAAAIEFDDADAASEALATLAANADAKFGAIVLPDGKLFASWGNLPSALAAAAAPEARGVSLLRGEATWSAPVTQGERTLGTLVIRSGLGSAFSQLFWVGGVMIAICLGGFVTAWGLSARLRESIATPLAELARSAEAMAGGDLSAETRIDRADEIGGLAKSFQRMSAGIRELVGHVRENTTAVSDESARLASASESMFEEARRHERIALDTASSVEELGAQVGELSRTSVGLAQNAAQASEAAGATERALTESSRGVGLLFETVDETAASVLQLTAAVRQIAGNAERLGEATQTTAKSMLALDESLREIESNARESHGATQEAAEAARRGEGAVDAAISGMGEVAESFGAVERIVADLAQRSKAIEQVLRVIEDVADQTNLLALNAAIIASQAGTHGLAFSVVASEVKGLAKRTAGSAREIGNSIGAVLKGIEAAVAATSAGAARVREGTRRSEEAGGALRAIRASSERSNNAVDAIANATEEQVRGVETVSAEMLRVKTMVEEIARATREQDNAGSEIQRGIETVRELAEGLKRSTGDVTDQSRLTARAVDSVAAALAQIRDGAESQRVAASQILEATQVFRDGASETTRRAEAMRGTVDALRERSAALDRELGRFH